MKNLLEISEWLNRAFFLKRAASLTPPCYFEKKCLYFKAHFSLFLNVIAFSGSWSITAHGAVENPL